MMVRVTVTELAGGHSELAADVRPYKIFGKQRDAVATSEGYGRMIKCIFSQCIFPQANTAPEPSRNPGRTLPWYLLPHTNMCNDLVQGFKRNHFICHFIDWCYWRSRPRWTKNQD